jgi:ribosomal protein S18 acetylase RimI-like enzyme
VLTLFEGEGWKTYTADPARTSRALEAPGSTTLVAIDGGRLVGMAQLQSDGEIQAHLSTIVVAGEARGRGVGARLIRERLRRAGGIRVDVITRNEEFYVALGAQPFSGFRLLPEGLER